MRSSFACLFALVCLTAPACLRSTEFHCSSNGECGTSGVCAPEGLCSVADTGCASGLRFSDTAGSHANQCVGGGEPIDASTDATDAPVAIDGAIDAPPTGCPSGYNTITGGQAGHSYRRITATDTWQTQAAFCAATSASAYLAIPEDLGELQAISTLAATTRYWIGISDLATEGTFLTVKNATPAFLPWETGAPDNGPPPENCVEAVSATSQINDAKCNIQQIAVCECGP